ncbi:hypothetical protein IU449_19575 [Nocardia higoensis]|uniref:Uncharacterized protein n=1 Tax=Nocardia higoensis TaxID=228599 RepID=A0ABS0DE84_9NOCA|nr:hypothetical protein [Nocardia higoensis]MBF6356719.1 hypothetical protein [Nocardia higoensis]
MKLFASLTVLTAPLSALLMTSAPAAAVSVTPSDSTVTVQLTQAEAAAITALNLGPVLGALPPNFTPYAKQLLGDNISRLAAQAARTPGSALVVVIDQPVASPPGVSVSVTR